MSHDPAFQPRVKSGVVDAREVLTWTSEEWLPFTKKMAMRRLGLPLFQRNARIVARNAGVVGQ